MTGGIDESEAPEGPTSLENPGVPRRRAAAKADGRPGHGRPRVTGARRRRGPGLVRAWYQEATKDPTASTNPTTPSDRRPAAARPGTRPSVAPGGHEGPDGIDDPDDPE